VRKVLIIATILYLFVVFIPSSYAKTGADFFNNAVKEEMKKSGRAEIYVETGTTVIIIFGLKSAMKEFRFDKITEVYEVKQIPKYEDSTKSQFHKEPWERIDETLKLYGK